VVDRVDTSAGLDSVEFASASLLWKVKSLV